MATSNYRKLIIGALLGCLGSGALGYGTSAAAGSARESGVRIAAHQSLVITVPAGVQQVSSDDPQVAEAVLVSSGDTQRCQVLIHGRTPGNTRLILWNGGSGQVMPVTVAPPQEQAPPSALRLNVNGFRILKVNSGLRRVAIGDESVAGVMLLPAEKPEDRTVTLMIDGRAPGVTNLLIWTGKQVDSLKVAVS